MVGRQRSTSWTRVVSNFVVYANGDPWELLTGGAIARSTLLPTSTEGHNFSSSFRFCIVGLRFLS